MAACRVLEDSGSLPRIGRVEVGTPRLRPATSGGGLGRGSIKVSRTYSNDLVGNRTLLTKSGDDPEYAWDLLNRMTEYQFDDGGGDAVTYTYRADGMRTHKFDTTGDDTEAWYFHDGQMCVQESSDDGTDVTVTKYGAGARGIDVITRKVNSGSETFGYPLYDTHGNMVATLARDGSGYTTGNEKSYDVWGGDRSGSSSVDQGYVANLGHRTDSESDLQYMRARYYEPSTGRFVSADPTHDGDNWFLYAANAPTFKVDFDGKFWDVVWSTLQQLWPLVQSFGLAGAVSAALKLAAGGAGFLLETIANGLFGVGYDMAAIGKAMADTKTTAGRIAGAAFGRVGAWMMQLAIPLRQLGYMLMFMAEEGSMINWWELYPKKLPDFMNFTN